MSIRIPGGRFGGTLLFGTTIFIGAFLVFLVQPMVAKRIVPWFGGTPGVWSLCLAFFQSALFLGYAYAHLLFTRFTPSRQVAIHALLFAVAFALLPVLPGDAWKPLDPRDPSAKILAMLASNVALPFFMLASTGPLLQAWFAQVYPGRTPYHLYALSNLGSLLALLAYPFVVEPSISLSLTSSVWSWGFVFLGIGVISCAWLAAQHPAHTTTDSSELQTFHPDRLRTGLCVALPACAVVLLMAVTNELCLDVASVPLLWVLPLCIYLVTFILCFASERLYPRKTMLGLALILAVALATLGNVSPLNAPGRLNTSPVFGQIAAYALVLFVCCMLLHGELYRLRPPPQRLTAYYLCISGGGAAGGLFVGLLAPKLFSTYEELPLGLVVGWTLILLAWWREPASVLRVGPWRRVWVAAACISLAAPLAQLALREPLGPNVLLQERSFYGVLRVFKRWNWKPPKREVVMENGTTVHGFQFLNPDMRSMPTDYFSKITGVGIAFSSRNPNRSIKVGVIGLGIGTLAAYGQAGDSFRFYEINPEVVRLARDTGHFSFLADSAAKIEIVEGDGRLSLESELRTDGSQQYDILVLDAFSSDSIPVHLLTLEAFELYVSHLREGGLLAINMATAHLRIAPLVHRVGLEVGLHNIFVLNRRNNRYFSMGSKWVILARKEATLQRFMRFGAAHKRRLGLTDEDVLFYGLPEDVLASAPLWTDDYSDLFSVVNTRSLF